MFKKVLQLLQQSQERLNDYINDDYDTHNWYYYHITKEYIGNTPRLRPQIPRTDSSIEDTTIKRISASPIIEGCIIGHPDLFNSKLKYKKNKKGERYLEMCVYRIRKKDIPKNSRVLNKKIVNSDVVFDADITEEVWITESVQASFFGRIIVYDNDSAIHISFTTTNSDEEEIEVTTYLFEYEWLEKVN